MKILNYFENTARGLWSLLVGLKITGVEFFRPWITTRYPYQEVQNLGTYRGHIGLVPRDEDPKAPKCIMCGRCMEICPSGCIDIKMHIKGEGNPGQSDESRTLTIGQGVELPFRSRILPPSDFIERELDSFQLNYNYCSLCGLCVQSCPVGSLKFSTDVYLAGTSRREFEFNLLERLKDSAVLTGSRKGRRLEPRKWS